MAYTINKTDGSLYATVANGTIDSTTSLTLVGKNYTGYGEIQNENYFRLLESHANLTPPGNPQTGQLWFDTTNSALNVYTDGTMSPKSLAVQATSLTEPAAIDSQIGDTWYNTTTKQLTIYDGSAYTTVGPLYTSTEGETGAIVTTITDTLLADHVVTQLMNNNEITAIVSKDASFTPNPAITGFATIEPGVTLSTSVAGAQFVGDASNALLLNGSPATDFLLSTADNTTTGKLDIVNDTGLTIGLSNDLRLAVTGGIHGLITNDTVNGDIYIFGSSGTGLTIDGASGNARVGLPNNGLDVVNQNYVTSEIANVDADILDVIADTTKTFTSFRTVGNTYSIAPGESAITQLTSNTIAFIEDSLDELYVMDFDGVDWTVVGSTTTPTQSPAIAALNSTDIAYIDTSAGTLQTKRFNGATWANVGVGLSLGTVSQPELTSLNSTDVAYFDTTNDELRTYRFDGTNWVLVGTGLSIPTTSVCRMSTLNATDIAFVTGEFNELRTYSFDGTNWVLVGNAFAMPTLATFGVATLNATDVIVWGRSTPSAVPTVVYRFDGTDWAEISYATPVPDGIRYLGSLNGTDFVYLGTDIGGLQSYRYDYYTGPGPYLP